MKRQSISSQFERESLQFGLKRREIDASIELKGNVEEAVSNSITIHTEESVAKPNIMAPIAAFRSYDNCL